MPDDSRVYDVVAFEELEFDEDEQLYTYQCPCGDLFEITQDELDSGERIAKCPSCSLRLKVLMPGDDQSGDDPDAMSEAEKKRAAAEALEEAEFAELDRKLMLKDLPVGDMKVSQSEAADSESTRAADADDTVQDAELSAERVAPPA